MALYGSECEGYESVTSRASELWCGGEESANQQAKMPGFQVTIRECADMSEVNHGDEIRPFTDPFGISASPRPSHLHGIALSADDLKDPEIEDHVENHHKSQQLLHTVLRHRGIHSDSEAPFIHKAEDQEQLQGDVEKQRQEFTLGVMRRLRDRGIHGVRSFRRMLHHMDMEGTGTVMGRTFEGALAHMGIRLGAGEFNRMLELFAVEDESETVDYVKIFAYGASNWSDQRQEVVVEAYDCLRAKCPGGLLAAKEIELRFQPGALTQTMIPGLVEHESAQEFLTQWSDSNLAPDGILRWADFLDYYLDISLSYDSDQDFCAFVCRSWGINIDDWLAKKVFQRYAPEEHDNVLSYEAFVRMIAELDPSMDDVETKAWYQAIDEDNSGEVTLDEFLSSKILKVKRLFDQFDEKNTRIADHDTMVKILVSLNGDITPEEAEAVYQYADVDNNGEVSFSEFLEKGLLKLLQIFDDFDRNRSRSVNETEMKALLARLDPSLDDSDLNSIYKAIDLDGSGSISFIEFCESHILQAKALFDRYDTTRSRALTQFKFREMVLSLDSTLTPNEQEAIYNLVADSNTEKVHFGGFLNPNIFRIKGLFDKYDQDRSRFLDLQEFRSMLKDIYKCRTDREITQIVETICPPGGDEGISFTTYIQRFKEIARKHEMIHLAHRRAAREKARARGLVWTG